MEAGWVANGSRISYTAPMLAAFQRFQPGQRVRVTQQIPRQSFGGGTMTTTIEGEVLRFYQGKTGSWFAHSKDDKLWLDRLEMKKDSGEIVTINLDQYSHIDVV